MALYILIAVFLLLWSFSRCLIFNIPREIFYLFRDIFVYIKDKSWKKFKKYGIDMFVGMFGHGKTLTMTHRARKLYKKYGDTIRFISNYHLTGIPYTELINFNQLVDLGEENDSPYQGTVILIDEIENVLSHRNFANFPLPLLHMLTQQRKKRVYIMCSAQRFFMVDKLFRSITTHVIDCNKYWRFQHETYYDAWDYENAMNAQLVKSQKNRWWFVSNKDFNAYDTSQMVSKSTAENFISNEESIVRRGLDATVNEQAIQTPSRRLTKQRKAKAS